MLRDRLRGERDEIVRRWRGLTLASYPEEARRFMATEADRFANPVGHCISEGLGALFDGLLSGARLDEMREPLEDIVKVRAVQELGAAEAAGFVTRLKEALAGVVSPASLPAPELIELREFEAAIDRLQLLAFDLYLADRERVYEIRANELAARSAKLIERLSRGKKE